MVTKILVGFDGSEAASRAFEFALGLAQSYRAKLSVATAFPRGPAAPAFGDSLDASLESWAAAESERSRVCDALEELRALGFARELVIDAAVLMGEPADEIVGHARRDGCDLLVVGRSGTGAHPDVLGSTTSRVLELTSAECEVIVVP